MATLAHTETQKIAYVVVGAKGIFARNSGRKSLRTRAIDVVARMGRLWGKQ
jgi:hypothetical protein